MKRLTRLHMAGAILLCAAVGVAATPALAEKKKAGETYTVQKKKNKRAAAKDCRKGPVPPFMRNPRFMNRGFLNKQCPS